MLNMVYSELLKLKKTYIIPIILICGTIMTIFMFLARFMTEHDMSFDKYSLNIEMINFLMLYTVSFSIVAGYVFSREFTDKTANVLYAYPANRLKIFISKVITIFIIIFLTYLIETISIPLSYYVLHHALPDENMLSAYLKSNISSLLFQFLLVPASILIANISKDIIMPVFCGVLGAISNMIVANNKSLVNLKYNPVFAPYISAQYFYFPNGTKFNYIIMPAAMFFVILMMISMYEFSKKDIN